MKTLSAAEIAAPIFKEHPETDRVYVVGQFGFINHNAAQLYAKGKRITEVLREGSTPAPTFTGDFDGMTKKELLTQATLRGMTLDSKMTNAKIIEALKTYDNTLGREVEVTDAYTIGDETETYDETETSNDPEKGDDPETNEATKTTE